MEMPHAPRVGPHHVVSALRGLHDAGTTQPLYMTLHIDFVGDDVVCMQKRNMVIANLA